MAPWLSNAGIAKSLEAIASLNCVFLPTVTVIMLCEFFMISRLLGQSHDLSHVPDAASLPVVRWPAFIALFAAGFVGVLTSGVIPGSEAFHVGVCSVQAWLTAIVVYMPLRVLEHRLSVATATTNTKRYIEKLWATEAAQSVELLK